MKNMKMRYIFIIFILLQASPLLTMFRMSRTLYRGQQANPNRLWWQKRSFSTTPIMQYEKKDRPIKADIPAAEAVRTPETTEYGFFAALKRFFWGEPNPPAQEPDQGSVPINEGTEEVSQQSSHFEAAPKKSSLSKSDELFLLFKYDIDNHGRPAKKTLNDLAEAILEDGNRDFFNQKINGYSFLYWFIDSLIKDTLQKIEIARPFEELDLKDIYKRIKIISQMRNLGASLNEDDRSLLRQNILSFEDKELKWIRGVNVLLKYLKCIAHCYKLFADLSLVDPLAKGVVNVNKAIRFANIDSNKILDNVKLYQVHSKDSLYNELLKESNNKLEAARALEQFSILYKLNFLNSPNDDVQQLFTGIKDRIGVNLPLIPEDVEMFIELALQANREILNEQIREHSLLFFLFQTMFDLLWVNGKWYDGNKKNIMYMIRQLQGAGAYLNSNDKNRLRGYLSRINPVQDSFYVKYPENIEVDILFNIALFYRLLLKFGVVDANDNSILNVKKCIAFSEADISDSIFNQKLKDIKEKDKNLYDGALFINYLRDTIERMQKEKEQREKERAESEKKRKENFDKKWEDTFNSGNTKDQEQKQKQSGGKFDGTFAWSDTKSPRQNLKDFLGLSENVSAQNIKKAFYEYSMAHHPDKVKLTPKQLVEFKKATDCWNDIKMFIDEETAQERRKK